MGDSEADAARYAPDTFVVQPVTPEIAASECDLPLATGGELDTAVPRIALQLPKRGRSSTRPSTSCTASTKNASCTTSPRRMRCDVKWSLRIPGANRLTTPNETSHQMVPSGCARHQLHAARVRRRTNALRAKVGSPFSPLVVRKWHDFARSQLFLQSVDRTGTQHFASRAQAGMLCRTPPPHPVECSQPLNRPSL